MPSIVETLSAWLDTSQRLRTFFVLDSGLFVESAKKFLLASNDESRARTATIVTRIILKRVDFIDADHFRQVVYRREAGGVIAYDGQRDHTAHTLHNWLLGWFIFDKSPRVFDLFKREAAKRGANTEQEAVLLFGGVWLHTSLLHDVGYIFEGSIRPLEVDLQSRQARIGASAVNEYFQSRLWYDIGFTSTYKRRLVLAAIGLTIPLLPAEGSITAIAETLRDLGDLSDIRNALGNKVPHLPEDAFDLWRCHYLHHAQGAAAERIRALERKFLEMAHVGLKGHGLRILDHGVCGGLTLLLAATFYYRLHHGSKRALGALPNKPSEEALRELVAREVDDSYAPAFWWHGVVWATAATALHNLAVSRDSGIEQLTVEDDVLAFLGVLVDAVQEWDRYFVFKQPGRVPLQAHDVGLGVQNDTVELRVPGNIREKIAEELNRALSNWEEVITLTEDP